MRGNLPVDILEKARIVESAGDLVMVMQLYADSTYLHHAAKIAQQLGRNDEAIQHLRNVGDNFSANRLAKQNNLCVTNDSISNEITLIQSISSTAFSQTYHMQRNRPNGTIENSINSLELKELLIEKAQKLVRSDNMFSVDNNLRQKYLTKGLKEEIKNVPYLLPSQNILSAISFLYLGLITELESIDEIVILTRGGLILDQPILHLNYTPLLLEIHSNKFLVENRSLGLQIEELDDLNLLSQRSVLIVDDDYHSGQTLSESYDHVMSYDPSKLVLFTLENEYTNKYDYCHQGHNSHYSLFKCGKRSQPESVIPEDFNCDFSNITSRRNMVLNTERVKIEEILDNLVNQYGVQVNETSN